MGMVMADNVFIGWGHSHQLENDMITFIAVIVVIILFKMVTDTPLNRLKKQVRAQQRHNANCVKRKKKEERLKREEERRIEAERIAKNTTTEAELKRRQALGYDC